MRSTSWSLRLRGGLSRRDTARVVVGMSMVSLLLLPFGTSAASTSDKKPVSLLQQGLNFYKGKTITIISPDAPGAGYDTLSRIVAPYMAAYLGATVNVSNDPPANTIAGQDLFAHSAPDELTIGLINAGADIEDIVTGTPGVNFNPQKVQFLGGNGPSGGNGFECSEPNPSGVTTFAEVVRSKSAISEIIVSTGSQTLTLDLINASFHIDARVIGGYENTSAEEAGQERGDGECGVLGISNTGFGAYMQAGKAKLLMETGSTNPATAYYSTTLVAMPFATAEKDFPATTRTERLARAALGILSVGVGHEFNAPASTAFYKVVALRSAVQHALTSVKVEDELLQAGANDGWVTGPRALKFYKAELAALTPVKSIIATALGV